MGTPARRPGRRGSGRPGPPASRPARPPEPRPRQPRPPRSSQLTGPRVRIGWPAMAEILNAHGSRNDIFVAELAPGDFASETDLRTFVRNLCDRGGPFGADGVYFYDAAPAVPEAWFFNPDGSAAEFCGNGMRCLGRVILDRRGIETAEGHSGTRDYTVRRAT